MNITTVDAEISTKVDTEIRETASNGITLLDVEARADAPNGEDDHTNDDPQFLHHNH